MKIENLKRIVLVVDYGFSITLAANKCNVTVPAISSSIKLVEKELCYEIFERTSRSLVGLTPKGEKAIEAIRDMVRLNEVLKFIKTS